MSEPTLDDFVQLSEEDLRKAVEGRPSLLLEQQAGTMASLEQISERKCGKCGGGLVPRTPANPLDVFSGARMNWQGWCPVCKVVG